MVDFAQLTERLAKFGKFQTGILSKFPLHEAALSGNEQQMRTLIKSGADMREKEPLTNLSPIYFAIMSKNVRIIEIMVKGGADINEIEDNYQASPLSCATILGNLNVVKCLVDLGANIHTPTYSGRSVVHLTAVEGHVEVMKFFIGKGLDVNVRDDNEETPLHCAVQYEKIEAVKVLVTNGADINPGARSRFAIVENENLGTNITPLFWAAFVGRSDIFDILIKAGANVNSKSSQLFTPLHAAAIKGRLEIVNMSLEANCSVNAKSVYGSTPLHYAIGNGHTKVVERLLKVKGIEVNPFTEEKGTPLIMAAGLGHLPIVKLLVASGAPINEKKVRDTTPLLTAAQRGKEKTADWLLRNGANIHATNCCELIPLHIACMKGFSLNFIKALVSKGSNVNAKSHEGRTPLHYASQMDYIDIVKYLVNCGANPDNCCKRLFTALHCAAQDGSIKTVKYLVSKAEINATADFRETPLHFAVAEGHQEISKILLECGANANALNNIQETPLHKAVEKGYFEITKLLLKHRANPNLTEVLKSQTPLFLAIKHKHKNIVAALLDKGADVNIRDKFSVLPIHVAVQAVSFDIVKALLNKGAYYNAEAQAENYSGTPLEMAQKTKDSKTITSLELINNLFSAVLKNDIYQIGCCVQAGAIVNARNANGRTVLHLAVSNGNVKAVSTLLNLGADLTRATDKGNLPLHMATAGGDSKIIKLLLTHTRKLSCIECNQVINAVTIEGNTTSLHIAAEKDNFYAVKLLIKNGAMYNATNKKGKTPFDLTTNDEVKVFFKSTEQLFEASKKEDGLEEVMQILENHGSVMNARDSAGGGTALYWAISMDFTDIAIALLDAGADYCLVTNKGTSPLHIAASKGNCEVVKALVSRMKSGDPSKMCDFINAFTLKGSAPLHVASSVDVVIYLLQEGATYNILNGQSKTAEELTTDDDIRDLLKTTHQLFDLIKKGASQVMNMLNSLKSKEVKAVMGARNEEGHTLLQVVSAGTNKKLANKLLEKSKNVH